MNRRRCQKFLMRDIHFLPRRFTSFAGHCKQAVLRIRYSQQRNNQESLSTFKQHIVSKHVEIYAGPRGGTTHRNQRRRSVKVVKITSCRNETSQAGY